MKKNINILIPVIIIIGIMILSIVIDNVLNKEEGISYKYSISNNNPFNNNLGAYGLIKTYIPTDDKKSKPLAKEIVNEKDLEQLKDIFLEAKSFNNSVMDCSNVFILEIFDKNKENSYLTDMWFCGENSLDVVIIFREEGTSPGEKRDKATGLGFSKEHSEIIRNIFMENDTLF